MLLSPGSGKHSAVSVEPSASPSTLASLIRHLARVPLCCVLHGDPSSLIPSVGLNSAPSTLHKVRLCAVQTSLVAVSVKGHLSGHLASVTSDFISHLSRGHLCGPNGHSGSDRKSTMALFMSSGAIKVWRPEIQRRRGGGTRRVMSESQVASGANSSNWQ